MTAPPIAFAIIGGYHVWQGAMILFDPAARNSTSLHALHMAIGGLDLVVLIGFGLAAMLTLFTRRMSYQVLLTAGQQLLLVVSALSAVGAMTSQSFADGVIRPFTFIAADQGVYVMLAVLHLVVILWRFGR
jgi:hypothetical protein